mmetsp:Transcript_34623/g.78260  ORF Transcript_34623/g.78260 Transcript_34623/m.78260 type:complete len:240 (+) Transcript_34623:106-825(+)
MGMPPSPRKEAEGHDREGDRPQAQADEGVPGRVLNCRRRGLRVDRAGRPAHVDAQLGRREMLARRLIDVPEDDVDAMPAAPILHLQGEQRHVHAEVWRRVVLPVGYGYHRGAALEDKQRLVRMDGLGQRLHVAAAVPHPELPPHLVEGADKLVKVSVAVGLVERALEPHASTLGRLPRHLWVFRSLVDDRNPMPDEDKDQCIHQHVLVSVVLEQETIRVVRVHKVPQQVHIRIQLDLLL